MYLRTEKEVRYYLRKSKKGKSHPFKRFRSYAIFECDSCHDEFKREKGKVDPKRLDNSYNHVCPDCDPKRFAQKKGVERRKALDTDVSKMLTIDAL